MNSLPKRDVIKKYSSAFNSWLNNMSIILMDCSTFDFFEFDENHQNLFFQNGYAYLKNDRYIDLRKAIALGKQIEYKELISTEEMTNVFAWKLLSNIDVNFHFDSNIEYRIKVENND